MEKTNYFNKVSRYLDNQMSTEERNEFEKELGNNPALYEEYEIHKEVNSYINNSKLIDFNNKLQELENNYPVKRKIKPWYRFAAIFVLLIAVGFIINFFIAAPSNQEIFDQYFSSSYSSMIIRSSKGPGNLLEEGVAAFDNKEYQKAIHILSKIATEHKEYISAYFYIGLSSMELESYQDAITHFEHLEKKSAHIYTDQVKWYLSLCYIITDQRSKAVPLLQSLVDEGMSYESKAKEVLRKLE